MHLLRSILVLVLLSKLDFGFAQSRLNVDSVFNYICKSGIKHPEIVIKQAVLETGWFKSPFLMSRNNIFAFRTKKYLRFDNWKACVDYYKNWQDRKYKDTTENYYDFLVRIKYATPEYPKHLKKIKLSKSCQ
jgi:flagellum-specific peptidoglycan hydrolase FlgJ